MKGEGSSIAGNPFIFHLCMCRVDQQSHGTRLIRKMNRAPEYLYKLSLQSVLRFQIEMCKRVKSSIETDHIPLIMLTAKSDIENRIEGLSLGAESYITKPFHPRHLMVRVAKLIEMRELLKERYSRKISLGTLQQPSQNSESPDELFMRKVIAVIVDKMVESEFNGDALAHELSISRMGLHRKIKALTGQSTGELIRNIRLKKAAELLHAHTKNISEVCYEVGFNSPSYFTTCFTEAFKMTPTEYARQNKKAVG